MRKISFSHVEISAGAIYADFKEENDGLLREDSFYISFDSFRPSDDTVALVFASSAGKPTMKSLWTFPLEKTHMKT